MTGRIAGDKSIAKKYEIHYQEFKEKEAADNIMRKNKEKEEIENQINNERKNFSFDNPNHVLVLGNQVKYVLTGDSVEIENENTGEALEKLRKIVAQKLIR